VSNINRLNKIISFDSTTINEIFPNKESLNNKKAEESSQNEKEKEKGKVISFVEIQNIISNDSSNENAPKGFDIEDIDFDAI